MSPATASPMFFVGWDVGGWNCDRNAKSRDALVILDEDLRVVGGSWRGNLRAATNGSGTAREFVDRVFGLCAARPPADGARLTLAIDTPLGFSREFVRLVTRAEVSEPVGDSATNAYLFRRTERFLFDRGLRPLSAVKDMIGSQATKGLHVLAKFVPVVERCGVWGSPDGLMTALEAYPSACKNSRLLDALRAKVSGAPRDTDDERDAVTCALTAYVFATQPHVLEPPGESVPESEGWIWLPKDILGGAPQRVTAT